MCRNCCRRSRDCGYDLNKSKHQSLLDRFQQSQARIKALKVNRETLLEELQSLANNFALADTGE
jgi:hypothetical protein